MLIKCYKTTNRNILNILIYLQSIPNDFLNCFYVSVYGQGYEKIGSKVGFKIQSSLRNANPSFFTTVSNPNPILIQLDPDYLLGSNQYLEVFLSSQVVVAGLSIQTPENFGLKSFTFQYAPRDVQYPGQMQSFQLRPDYPMVKYY